MSEELAFLGIGEAARRIAARELSPVELVEACLARIEAAEPLGAFWTLTAESARAEAKAAEEAIERDGARHPLHGIPIAHKDLYDTAGVRTTAGASFLLDRVPERDAFTVAKLRRAGAISLGKLALHELAAGVTSQNPHFPTCRNPWDPERIPGGSSGGSGIAVSAGLAFAATGSDTGGSIRIPAALCGCVGLKPTYGLASRRGVVPLAWSLDHMGPLARSVADAALVMETMAGHDPEDPASAGRPAPPLAAAAGEPSALGVRVALVRGYSQTGCVPAVGSAVAEAARVLEGLGAEVCEIDLPELDRALGVNTTIMACELATLVGERFEALGPEAFGPDVAALIQAGCEIPARGYLNAQRERARIQRGVAAAMADVDLLLFPSSGIPAPRIGQEQVEVEGVALPAVLAIVRYTAPVNVTGQPAIALPAGFDEDGLPVSVQLVGRPFEDAGLVRVAAALEAELAPPVGRRRPSIG